MSTVHIPDWVLSLLGRLTVQHEDLRLALAAATERAEKAEAALRQDGPPFVMNGKPMPPCPDCAALYGQPHDINCDIPRCMVHGGQRLQCDCGTPPTAWDGRMPDGPIFTGKVDQ